MRISIEAFNHSTLLKRSAAVTHFNGVNTSKMVFLGRLRYTDKSLYAEVSQVLVAGWIKCTKKCSMALCRKNNCKITAKTIKRLKTHLFSRLHRLTTSGWKFENEQQQKSQKYWMRQQGFSAKSLAILSAANVSSRDLSAKSGLQHARQLSL